MEKETGHVGIGLPVYNGQRYLAAAIESIIGQTFEDFELVITDNASTDRTPEICRDYAARDRRIRYHRNKHNLGAAANYNLCYELATAEYFKWAAHDDTLEPEFLAKCVAALRAEPDAVLCHCETRLVDETDAEICFFDNPLSAASSPRASDRFAALILKQHFCYEFFGVIRRDLLRGTPLHGSYHGADRALLAILALRGRFLRIQEPLFNNRHHSERYSYGVAIGDRAAWHDPRMKNRPDFPLWSLYRDYLWGVQRYVSDPVERRRCYWQLAKWWFVNFNAIRMAVDAAAAYEPRVFSLASVTKRRVFGSADDFLRIRQGEGKVE